ncbi:hypothetical protein BDN70DRAFT_928653 [Pholiota conissans]|uniref:C2 domain-containing protein n=1 Tax=Pholiota conissans TaxID=109636 RepID=A0A9P5ZC91_9AGAR|nr:hypothetical protein BDN70DRAFT_928653 [Pholiota conissans]
MANVTNGCPEGLSSNPDISGPGVRIALYLQSLLSVLLVRFSPRDAPGAYWSMTSTAFSLIISSIVTSVQNQITLLDAIVVVYVTLLPVLASAFGLSEIMTPALRKNSTRAMHSPLLIIANWVRSALTYSFAMYVWISAPTLGSGTPACNAATKLIFFGASLPALGSGRWLSLAIWSLATLLFLKRTLQGSTTIFYATRALFSTIASQKLLKPKRDPKREVRRETVTRKDFGTGEVSRTSRLYRPRQNFHELFKGLTSQILGWAPTGTGAWYRAYGKTILITFLAAWAIIMTELELLLNHVNVNKQWGFGQILPLLLTISPLFSLWESILARRSAGPYNKPRKLRFTISKGRGLQRPHCELDPYSREQIEQMKLKEDDIKRMRAPSPFAVVTINEEETFTTFEEYDTHDPDWNDQFDVEINDLATIAIRVFDRKCIDRDWPAFIGFTTIHPFTVMSNTQVESAEDSTPSGEVKLENIPLVRDDTTTSDTTISLTLSLDTSEEPTLLFVPPHAGHARETRVERRVALVKFGNKKTGRKKETVTHIYQMSNLV